MKYIQRYNSSMKIHDKIIIWPGVWIKWIVVSFNLLLFTVSLRNTHKYGIGLWKELTLFRNHRYNNQ